MVPSGSNISLTPVEVCLLRSISYSFMYICKFMFLYMCRHAFSSEGRRPARPPFNVVTGPNPTLKGEGRLEGSYFRFWGHIVFSAVCFISFPLCTIESNPASILCTPHQSSSCNQFMLFPCRLLGDLLVSCLSALVLD